MSRRFRIRQVDVFTDRPLSGNPLAVFPDAAGLAEDEMQALASETNLSETTFVLPPSAAGTRDHADYRLRIFTPGMELPFAGHPSIGTAWVLVDEGRVTVERGRATVRQELPIGVLPISVDGREVTMTQGAPEILHRLEEDEADELCGLLEVTPATIGWPDTGRRSRVPPAVVSTGLPHLIVPFREREVMDEIDRDRGPELADFAGSFGTESVALIAPGGSGAVPGADACVRLFDADRMRIRADPATGAAAGPIAVYLGRLTGVRGSTYRVVLEQGAEVGRPSRLVAEADFGPDGRPVDVRVSGAVVPVMEGWVTLP